MTIDYGQDLNFLSPAGLDMSPRGDVVTDFDILAQAIVIRLSTGRTVIDAPDDGIDITEMLSRAMGQVAIANLSNLIEQEILKDERFTAARASVDASELTSSGSITITLSCDSGAGPFQLTLSASAAGVLILAGA